MPTLPETITVNDREFYQWDMIARISADWRPGDPVFIAVAPPGGDAIINAPALVKGDTGFAPTIQADSDITELEYNDPTAATLALELVTPGTDDTPPVYKLTGYVRKGTPGEAVPVVLLDATDLTGTPLAAKMLVVNATADGVTFASQPKGKTYWPASVTEASADTTQTLCVVSVPAADFDRELVVHGGSLVTGDGAGDCVVNLLARLNGETTGVVLGRSIGRSGTTQPPHYLFSAPPAGSAAGFNKVSAGAAATVHLRAERQSGADTFGTAQTLFSVEAIPV